MNNQFLKFKFKEQPLSAPIPSKPKDRAAAKGQLFMRLSLQDQVMFIKELAVLIRAGIPLFLALQMIRKQGQSRTMNHIMDHVLQDVENGQSLAISLGKFKKIFGELVINVISISEISGTLSENLDHLAAELKKKQTLRRKVIGASIYPIVIILATIAITIILMVFVFPKIIPIFQSVNYTLPWTTRALIAVSKTMSSRGEFIVGGLIALFVGIVLLLRIKKLRFWFDKLLLMLPLVKKMVQSYNMANICRTLGLLLNSSVVVVRTFHITSNTTKNLAYKKELNDIAEKLLKGGAISTHMSSKPKLFPFITSQMVAVGETTGKLSETFLYLADMYEEKVEDLTKNLSTMIEPFLLIVMGLLVGFVAVSIITPIYGLTQHLAPK